jgi:hypothetical protein
MQRAHSLPETEVVENDGVSGPVDRSTPSLPSSNESIDML